MRQIILRQNGKSSSDSAAQALERVLLQEIKKMPIAPTMHELALQLREQVIREIARMDSQCVDKQRLVDSLEVVKGARDNEYLLVSRGNYGTNIDETRSKNC